MKIHIKEGWKHHKYNKISEDDIVTVFGNIDNWKEYIPESRINDRISYIEIKSICTSLTFNVEVISVKVSSYNNYNIGCNYTIEPRFKLLDFYTMIRKEKVLNLKSLIDSKN